MENTNFKVFVEEKTQNYGKFFLEPLERGYGDTLGNALRRLLLSSIRGAAVIAVRIEGVLHEFSTIRGIREDVIEILMNLKQIPIKAKTETVSSADGCKVVTLDSDNLPKDFFTREENPGVITAKDIPFDSDFEFCGDNILCTLDPDPNNRAHLLMEIYVSQGVGYLSSDRERPAKPQLSVDALLTDAIFSPVTRVNYQIEPARVGQSIDYERLVLEVWTNGATTPEEAIKQAAEIAENCFGKVAKDVLTAEIKKPEPIPEPKPKTTDPDKAKTQKQGTKQKTEPETTPKPLPEPEPEPEPPLDLEMGIKDSLFGLSLRTANSLLRGGIETVGDLTLKSYDDLLQIRNLGKKSIKEIEEKLGEMGGKLKPSEPTPAPQPEPKPEPKPESVQEFSSGAPAKDLVSEIFEDTESAVNEAAETLANTSESSEEEAPVKEPEKVETVKKPAKKAKTVKAAKTEKKKPASRSKKSEKVEEAEKPAKKSTSRSKKVKEPKEAEKVETPAEVVEAVEEVKAEKPVEAEKPVKKTSSRSKKVKEAKEVKEAEKPEKAEKVAEAKEVKTKAKATKSKSKK